MSVVQPQRRARMRILSGATMHRAVRHRSVPVTIPDSRVIMARERWWEADCGAVLDYPRRVLTGGFIDCPRCLELRK